MPYISQETKKKLAPGIKSVLKKYNMKGYISIKHNSVLKVTLMEGCLDLVLDGNFNHCTCVVPDLYEDDKRKEFLEELFHAMSNAEGVHNDSEYDQVNQFRTVDWYTRVAVGASEKPYKLN